MSYSYNFKCYTEKPPNKAGEIFSGNGIPYYSPYLVRELIYSVDRIQIVFTPDNDFVNEIRSDEYALCRYIQYATTSGINMTYNQYYQTYYLKYGLSTMTIKLLLNSGYALNQCTLEVNPNRCFEDKRCIEAISFLLSRSVRFHFRVLDVAVDVPLPRSMFRIEKDRRKKLTVQSSKVNSTEYCGKRNNPGYCKLYDKMLECDLSEPWTRIEITYGNPLMEDFFEQINAKLPRVKQKSFNCAAKTGNDNDKLSSTDLVLIALLQAVSDEDFKSAQFKSLDRKKQNRLKPFVYAEETDFEFNLEAIQKVMFSILDVITPHFFIISDKEFINENYIERKK